MCSRTSGCLSFHDTKVDQLKILATFCIAVGQIYLTIENSLLNK